MFEPRFSSNIEFPTGFLKKKVTLYVVYLMNDMRITGVLLDEVLFQCALPRPRANVVKQIHFDGFLYKHLVLELLMSS